MYDISDLIIALEDLSSKGIKYVDLNDLGNMLRVTGVSVTGCLTVISHDLYSKKSTTIERG